MDKFNLLNKADFENMYNIFYPKIYNYIFYRLLNKEVTEDLVSDVFLKVIAKSNTYNNSKSELSTWIFTIAKNVVIDYYRKNKPTSYINEEIEKGNEKKFVVMQDEFTNTEDKLVLQKALKTLTERERTIIALKYYSGMDYKQIAEHIGKEKITPNNISVILNRALKKLKTILDVK